MDIGAGIGLKLGKATRDAFGDALLELGKKNPRIVALDGDLSNSTKTEVFGKEFPERFFNVGIAESNLVGMAGGLASCDKIPFIASFAAFIMCNAYDQLRMSIAFPNPERCRPRSSQDTGPRSTPWVFRRRRASRLLPRRW